MSADPAALSSLAPYELARLAGRVRRSGRAGGSLAALAGAIVDTLWDAFGQATPPALGIVGVYRVPRGGGPSLVAGRTLDAAPPPASIDGALLERLETAPAAVAVAVAGKLAGERERVLRYGIQTIVVAAAPFGAAETVALAIYARVAIAPEIAETLQALAPAACLALARARR